MDNYIPTRWIGGQTIGTADKMNNMENGIVEAHDRLDIVDEQFISKANKNEVFSMANMGQDVKEAMTGGSVAVVGVDTILSKNIVDKQVTPSKISLKSNLLNMEIVNGQYLTAGILLGKPTSRTDTCATLKGLVLDLNNVIELKNTDYKYTIVRFENDIQVSAPTYWITSTTLKLTDFPQEITSNMKLAFQIRRVDGAEFTASDVSLSNILFLEDKLIIENENLKENSITEDKLSVDLVSKINKSESETENVVDLVMFMGQSNMAGRGVASESPVVPEGHGYEFRAISNPTKLYNIVEPFGVNENNSVSGITEGNKTGSMVSSFVKAYYECTKTPIVAVSCAKGGTSIDWWQPSGLPLNDAINRHNKAKQWLLDNGYTIRHDFMVWCQGETDGDKQMTSQTYKERIELMIEEMIKHGIEKCFIIRIGNNRDNVTLYDDIIQAQTELCKEYENAVLVSTKFDKMATDGLMKDSFHYIQEGYNIAGRDAGINTAFYINNLKEPAMYDWENQNLYYSYKI